jgi:hypothetical protein
LGLQLDHIFYFVENEAQAEAWVSSLGLVESYRRQHPGQGTENICCCFNNAYLEFLWVNNADEVTSPQTAPLGFAARSAWSHLGAAPMGLALRQANDETLPFETWNYCPDYLPYGTAIAMATDSDDTRQPLIFVPPMGARPDQWAIDRAVPLNEAILKRVELLIPVGIEPSPNLQHLGASGLVTLSMGQLQWGLTLTLYQPGVDRPVELSLPIW